ncbi:MAG: ATP-binding protein [Bacteroidales bacterium]
MEAILNEELNQVFENAAVALILVDKEGRIKLINKAGEELFGQRIVDVKGKLAGEAFKCVHALINDYVVCGKTEECPNCPLRNSFEDTYNTGENHYKVHGNLDIQGEDSTYQLYLLISTSLLNVTSNKYVLLTIEDITKEIDLQNELKERGKELEELIATRNKFFSIIAYDLINSFSTIEGFAKLLLEESSSFTTEERESFLQLIVNSSQNTNRSLENLILWSRLQVGNMDYVLENVNIVDLINDTVSQLRAMAQKKNINIEVSLPEQLCLILDKFMISTVLRNLITNAIKYTHKSGSISINLEEKEGRIQVSVKDNGIGIYKENIEKLFKITEKFSMQGTEQEEGTGLGLILSKEFIDLHNGEIMVESQIGKGSTFTFTLPV